MHVDKSGKSALNDQVLDGEARYPGEPEARCAAQADGVGFIDRSRVAPKGRRVEMCLNNLAPEVGGFRYSRGFSPRGCPRFAVTPTTKSLLTQPLYGKGRNPPLSKPPELALGDAFSGLNDYDTGVTPGCCSGWNGLADPFRGVGFFFKICVQHVQTSRRIAVDPATVVIFTLLTNTICVSS